MRKGSLLGMALVLVLAGCSLSAPPPPTYPPATAQSIAQRVDALSENLLVAMSNRDEAGFTRDMDEAMKQNSSGARFEELQRVVVDKVGSYVPGSKQVVKVDTAEGYQRVFYDATFEQESHVQVLVVFDLSAARPLVSGLWFDSPKLTEQ